MAPNTALGFLLISTALLLCDRVRRTSTALQTIALTFAVMAIGLTGLVGYLQAPDLLFGWARSARMAIHTEIGMLLAAAGLWAYWSRAAWYASGGFVPEGNKIRVLSAAIIFVATVTAGAACLPHSDGELICVPDVFNSTPFLVKTRPPPSEPLPMQLALAGDTGVAYSIGDECTVVLEDLKSPIADAERLVGKLVQTLRAPFSMNGHALQISASVGLVVQDPAHHPEPDPTQLLRSADEAMYVAKRCGKDAVVRHEAATLPTLDGQNPAGAVHRALS
jgi:hypothetical protein